MLTWIFLLLMIHMPQNGIEIKDAWIRPAAKGMNSALYFEIVNHNNTPDTLFDAKSNAAKVVEVHETYKKGDMMGMRRTPTVGIEPSSSFKFQPGGHHVMLINLTKNLKEGSSADVSLYFKDAGEIKFKAAVKR